MRSIGLCRRTVWGLNHTSCGLSAGINTWCFRFLFKLLHLFMIYIVKTFNTAVRVKFVQRCEKSSKCNGKNKQEKGFCLLNHAGTYQTNCFSHERIINRERTKRRIVLGFLYQLYYSLALPLFKKREEEKEKPFIQTFFLCLLCLSIGKCEGKAALL